MWNDQQGWYADYDLKSHKVRNQLTAAALFPLYVNAAAKDRANKMATATKTHLLQPGGLNTTSVKSGQQWDAPKWLGTVTVGRDRRITKLRAKRGGDGH
ncbi:trehalase family glycosidase [Escherichia coli]